MKVPSESVQWFFRSLIVNNQTNNFYFFVHNCIYTVHCKYIIKDLSIVLWSAILQFVLYCIRVNLRIKY